jgi:tripartite-type tricarboxylate transporter receptor subunit TctC
MQVFAPTTSCHRNNMRAGLSARFPVGICMLGLTVMVAGAASAQNFPVKPIRVLTSEPGGGGDVMLRIMQPSLTSDFGQPIVIDNRPLAVSGEIVARALPDGYTLTVFGTTLWLGPLMQPMRYDPLRDFAPITLMSTSPGVILVHPSLAVSSIKELIALAKAKPGVLNYGSGASGSTTHLGVELFKSMAGVDLVRITYKGAGPATNALISGEVQLMFSATTGVAAHIKSGRAKALAVTTAQRSALMPDLPTVSESGLPGYEAAFAFGMVTTAKTPAAIVNRLNQGVVQVLRRADIREKLLNTGTEVAGTSPQEFGAMMKSEIARMSKVIKDAGIRAN